MVALGSIVKVTELPETSSEAIRVLLGSEFVHLVDTTVPDESKIAPVLVSCSTPPQARIPKDICDVSLGTAPAKTNVSKSPAWIFNWSNGNASMTFKLPPSVNLLESVE